MPSTLTASILERLKKKVMDLQAKRSDGSGSDLLTHRITAASDPVERPGDSLDPTVRELRNALLDVNDFDSDNTMYRNSAFAEDLDVLERRVDKLLTADESSHGCRGLCAGLCTGACFGTCNGCTGCAGGCTGTCTKGCTGAASATITR